MLYFYCAYVNYVSPYQEPISCWSDPYASSATVALIQPYGTRPPTTFTASGVFYDTSNWINMTRSFWAIDVGGICLCISHIISAFLHFVRPCHKLAKPFSFLNHLCTFPYLIVATLWRFCAGGEACAAYPLNNNLIDPLTESAGVVCSSDLSAA